MLRCAIVEDSPRELEHLKECLARYSAERDIPLDDKAFRYWNVKTDRWETEGGSYQLLVGASVQDIRLRAEVPVRWPDDRRHGRAGDGGRHRDGSKGFWIIGLLRALIGFGQNAVSNRKFRAALDAERGGPAV